MPRPPKWSSPSEVADMLFEFQQIRPHSTLIELMILLMLPSRDSLEKLGRPFGISATGAYNIINRLKSAHLVETIRIKKHKAWMHSGKEYQPTQKALDLLAPVRKISVVNP